MPRKINIKNLDPKKIWFQNNSESEKFWIKEFFVTQNILDPKNVQIQNFLVKNFPSWHVQTWTDQTCLYPRCPYHMYQIFADQKNYWINKSYQRPSSYILQIPSSHLPDTHRDTFKTTCRHSQDTLQTLKKHHLNTLQTLLRYPQYTLYTYVFKKDGLRVGGGWVGGFRSRIMPRCGSILQAETCQILSEAENLRWSRVWQNFGSENLFFWYDLIWFYLILPALAQRVLTWYNMSWID